MPTMYILASSNTPDDYGNMQSKPLCLSILIVSVDLKSVLVLSGIDRL